MNKLTGRLAAKAGMQPAMAEKIIGLRDEGGNQNIAGELLGFGRDKTGAAQGAIVAGTPGFTQFA